MFCISGIGIILGGLGLYKCFTNNSKKNKNKQKTKNTNTKPNHRGNKEEEQVQQEEHVQEEEIIYEEEYTQEEEHTLKEEYSEISFTSISSNDIGSFKDSNSFKEAANKEKKSEFDFTENLSGTDINNYKVSSSSSYPEESAVIENQLKKSANITNYSNFIQTDSNSILDSIEEASDEFEEIKNKTSQEEYYSEGMLFN